MTSGPEVAVPFRALFAFSDGDRNRMGRWCDLVLEPAAAPLNGFGRGSAARPVICSPPGQAGEHLPVVIKALPSRILGESSTGRSISVMLSAAGGRGKPVLQQVPVYSRAELMFTGSPGRRDPVAQQDGVSGLRLL